MCHVHSADVEGDEVGAAGGGHMRLHWYYSDVSCYVSCAFDTIDHNILITRLRSTFGCSGTVLDWFISYLSYRAQSVSVGHESTPSVLKCGVPQKSVLGPLLFTLYTHPLSTVTCQSGLLYYFFADDSQLHKSSVASDFPVLACCLKNYIEVVAEWMGDNKWRWMMIKLSHLHQVQIKSGHSWPCPYVHIWLRYTILSVC